MPDSGQQARAIRRGGQRNNTLQPNNAICFVYVQLYDDACEQVLVNTQYTLRSIDGNTSITSTTDKNGILRHEFLPDDHFDVVCGGKTETVEVYYMAEMGMYEGKPCSVRMRDLDQKSQTG